MSSSGSQTSSPAPETESLEAHGLESAVPGQDHQVGPGNLPAVLGLDRPEQAACFVQVGVVGPTVEGGEALGTVPRPTTSVVNAVGAGTVPGHADEERPVVTVVGGPPVLGGRHHLDDVGLYRREVQALELCRVVEHLSHGVDER